MDLTEWDVFPEELQTSYSSPRIPEYLTRTPEQAPPTMAIPTMTMDQQMNQAEQRAQWQAQQVCFVLPQINHVKWLKKGSIKSLFLIEWLFVVPHSMSSGSSILVHSSLVDILKNEYGIVFISL